MAAFCGERGSTVHVVTAHAAIAQAVVAGLRRLWALLSTWRARAVQRRALAALDHRLLRDVGLTPDRAAAESQKPFWRA